MATRLDTRRARTQELINYFRGNADEIAMLKGVLCVSNVMEGQDETRWKYFIDSAAVGARMDEILKALING